MKIHKRLFIAVTAALSIAWLAPAEAKGDDDWKVLDSARYAYERKEFGEALRLVDRARAIHVSKVESDRDILLRAVRPQEVKKAGDDLIAVYRILEKRNDETATAVLDRIYLKQGPLDFGNSFQRLMVWLSERAEYPEADILTGKIYEAEGEFTAAISFLKKAWDKRSYLEIPDDRFSIAYHMADMAAMQGKFGEQEEYLLLVLTDDEVYGSPGNESTTLQAMVRSIKADPTMAKFFMLYRHDRPVALKAYQDLARHFADTGRMDRAFPVAVLAACASMTALAKNLQALDFQYTYSDFPDLVRRSAGVPKLTQWANGERIWDSFLVLATVMWESGEREQAAYIWNCMASFCPDGAVARKASGELASRKL